MFKKFFSIFWIFLLFISCGGGAYSVSYKSPQKNKKNKKSPVKISYSNHSNKSSDDSIEDVIYNELSERQQELLKKYKSPGKATYSLTGSKFDIPMTMNSRVQKWIDYFAYGSGRKSYERWLGRSTRFVPIELNILQQHKVPKDLIFLSMIESGYNTHALSTASAAGLWQFIRSTGRLYGLEADYWVDERRDPEKASHAAARHLKDLYDEFGDWYLAFGAYNAGAGRIRRAIDAVGSRNFWDLADSKHLPQETKDYVPKIIAAAIIGKAPEKYGFTDIEYQTYIPTESVSLSGPADLEVIADSANTSVAMLRLLNPELKRSLTPPQQSNYNVKLPKGTKRTFEISFAKLSPKERLGDSRIVLDESKSVKAIAAEHGITIQQLYAANPNWDSARNIPSGSVLLVPKSYEGAPSMEQLRLASSTSKGNRLVDIINSGGVAIADKQEKQNKKTKKKEEKVKDESSSETPNIAQIIKSVDSKTTPPDTLTKQNFPVVPKAPDNAQANKTQTEAPSLTTNSEEKLKNNEPAVLFPESPSQENSLTGEASSLSNDQKILEALGKISPPSQNKEEAVLRVKSSGEEATNSPSKTIKKVEKSELIEAKNNKNLKTKALKTIIYTVKPGDNLTDLAEKYGVSIAEIQNLNKLKRSQLLKGEKIKIQSSIAQKDTKETNSKIIAKNTKKTNKQKVISYKVKKGDTLDKIAKKYDIEIKELKSFNKLKKSTLLPGFVIRIPKLNSDEG